MSCSKINPVHDRWAAGKGCVYSNAAHVTPCKVEKQRVPRPRGYGARLGQGKKGPSGRGAPTWWVPGGRVQWAGENGKGRVLAWHPPGRYPGWEGVMVSRKPEAW